MSAWVLGIVWAPLDEGAMIHAVLSALRSPGGIESVLIDSHGSPAFPFAVVWHDGWGDTTERLRLPTAESGDPLGRSVSDATWACQVLNLTCLAAAPLSAVQRRAAGTPQEGAVASMIAAISGSRRWQQAMGGTAVAFRRCLGCSLDDAETLARWSSGPHRTPAT